MTLEMLAKVYYGAARLCAICDSSKLANFYLYKICK